MVVLQPWILHLQPRSPNSSSYPAIYSKQSLVEEARWCKEWQGLMELCGGQATEILLGRVSSGRVAIASLGVHDREKSGERKRGREPKEPWHNVW
jgi:hypothetical protein